MARCPRSLTRLLPAAVLLLIASPVFAQGTEASKKSYVHVLQPADRVRVSVYGEEDLTSVVRINSNGRVPLQLVEEVAIGGLTLTQAQVRIQEAYKDGRYLRNPQVTITVEEYAPREVSINGAVRNPARYALPVESTYTLVELVTKAGGFTDIAKGTAVTVTRFRPDGSKQVFTIDVESIIKGKKGGRAEDNAFLLEPGDIVNVPEALI